jgi:hypothetical protein
MLNRFTQPALPSPSLLTLSLSLQVRQQILSRLPVSKEGPADDVCAVCLTLGEEGADWRVLPCNHRFHREVWGEGERGRRGREREREGAARSEAALVRRSDKVSMREGEKWQGIGGRRSGREAHRAEMAATDWVTTT